MLSWSARAADTAPALPHQPGMYLETQGPMQLLTGFAATILTMSSCLSPSAPGTVSDSGAPMDTLSAGDATVEVSAPDVARPAEPDATSVPDTTGAPDGTGELPLQDGAGDIVDPCAEWAADISITANPANPVTPGTSVELIAWNNSTAVVSYAWVLLEVPATSAALLFDANAERAGLVPDVPGTYRVRLFVSDGLAQCPVGPVEVIAVSP